MSNLKYVEVEADMYVKQYFQYNDKYNMDLHTCHNYSTLLNQGTEEFSELLDKKLFEAILDYMALYSIKYNIGKAILESMGINFSNIADCIFGRTSEKFLIIYEE